MHVRAPRLTKLTRRKATILSPAYHSHPSVCHRVERHIFVSKAAPPPLTSRPHRSFFPSARPERSPRSATTSPNRFFLQISKAGERFLLAPRLRSVLTVRLRTLATSGCENDWLPVYAPVTDAVPEIIIQQNVRQIFANIASHRRDHCPVQVGFAPFRPESSV